MDFGSLGLNDYFGGDVSYNTLASLFGGGGGSASSDGLSSLLGSAIKKPSFSDSFTSALGSALPSSMLALGSYFINKPKTDQLKFDQQLAQQKLDFEKQQFGQLSAYEKAALAQQGSAASAATAAQLAIAKQQMIARAMESRINAALTGRGAESNSFLAIAKLLQSGILGGT